MSQHPNARLTPLGRAELVARVGSGTPVAEAARQMGVSRQTASKWLSRARRGEPMSDRPCRPARLARSTPPADVERVCVLSISFERKSHLVLSRFRIGAQGPSAPRRPSGRA